MTAIKSIRALEILDSQKNPTIQASVVLDNNLTAVASCPSGTSVGSFEVLELRDNDPRRYNGKGVLKAIKNIELLISPRLIGMEITNQEEIDDAIVKLDATANKSKLGANAMLAVSLAVCRVASKSLNIPLFRHISRLTKREGVFRMPTPVFNLINGGKHALDNLDFQEFLVIPDETKIFKNKLDTGKILYESLKNVLVKNGLKTNLGIEGGFAPKLSTNIEALSFLKQAVEAAKLTLGVDVFFGLDVAANSFYKNGRYYLKDKKNPLLADELIEYYKKLEKMFPLVYLEDPLAQDDFKGWENLTSKTAVQTHVVGDDFIATNPTRLRNAINRKAISGVIIKPNQIGTVSETLAVVKMAKDAGLSIVVSHRSGETDDDFIADFAVGVGADYVKFGALVQKERIAKYNRLLAIEQELLNTSDGGPELAEGTPPR